MNRSSLLPIGAFSSATQLSAKALRLYAEYDILRPASIDADTGYRYYRAEQVHEARLVRMLRELDVPLADIAALLAAPATIEAQLKRRMDMLAQRHRQQQIAFQAALALLRPAPISTIGQVIKRMLPAMEVLTEAMTADDRTLAPRARKLLNRLTDSLGQESLKTSGAFVQLSAPLSTNDEIALELCVPIAADVTLPDTHASRHWPQQSLACVEVRLHDGIADFTSASDALFDWFDRNGVALEHAPMIFLHGETLELAWPIS